MGELIKEYFILIRKTEEKRPLGIPKRRWKGNNMVDFKQIDCVNWNYSDAVAKSVNVVINCRVSAEQL
jgi:hypothetical protein